MSRFWYMQNATPRIAWVDPTPTASPPTSETTTSPNGDTSTGGDSPPSESKPEVTVSPESSATATSPTGFPPVPDDPVPSHQTTELYQPVAGEPNNDVRAIKIGPSLTDPVFYSNCIQNVDKAIEKRITEKQLECKATREDKREVGTFVRESLLGPNAIWTKDRIQQWISDHPLFEDCKSKKWSTDRFNLAFDKMMTEWDPRFKYSAIVKNEPMKTGKAPRLLIADGDDGMIMSLCAIKCMEDILFDVHYKRCIKHEGKRQAIRRVTRELRDPRNEVTLVEGDGSAWDTCCNAIIRDCAENPVIDAITKQMIEAGYAPQQWLDAHAKANEEKHLTLFFRSKHDCMKRKIAAIRRSGHRGTSVLNWWINFVCWTTTVFGKKAKTFLDTARVREEDMFHVKRFFKCVFEGDDSLLAVSPTFSGDEMKTIEEKWTRWGFNMKLFIRKEGDVATFCGYWIATGVHGCTDTFAPEVTRLLTTSAFTVSPSAIANRENKAWVASIAASSYLARAFETAGILPALSRQLLSMARFHGIKELTPDDLMRVTGDTTPVGVGAIVDEIEHDNLCTSVEDEHTTLRALQIPATVDELHKFRSLDWTDPRWLSSQEFRQALPYTWRKI